MSNLTSIHLQASIPLEFADMRFDVALAKIFPEYSRATLQQWLKQEQITLNGHSAKASLKLQGHETVNISALIQADTIWQAQAITLDIVYEDDSIIIINKPVGLVVHPGAGNPDHTLVNALLHHAPQLAALPRAGIIHRLDKGTSGLLVVSKTLTAHHYLVQQLQARHIKREYVVIVNGILIAGGTIDAPIGRHPTQRKRMAVVPNSRDAVTHYRVLERFRAHTYLAVQLETGRTHQIRVHMAHIRHPLVGDATYSSRPRLPKGAQQELIQVLQQYHHQALHAIRLGLNHPLSKAYMEWQAPIPADMQNLLEMLRDDNNNHT